MIEPLGADTLVYCCPTAHTTPLVVHIEGSAAIAEGRTLALSRPTCIFLPRIAANVSIGTRRRS